MIHYSMLELERTSDVIYSSSLINADLLHWSPNVKNVLWTMFVATQEYGKCAGFPVPDPTAESLFAPAQAGHHRGWKRMAGGHNEGNKTAFFSLGEIFAIPAKIRIAVSVHTQWENAWLDGACQHDAVSSHVNWLYKGAAATSEKGKCIKTFCILWNWINSLLDV